MLTNSSTQHLDDSADGSSPEPNTVPPSVRIVGLTKFYGDVPAVRGLDLTLDPGEFVTLLGPSGCGKTTTLRVIAGLERATTGLVELFGETMVDISRGIDVPPSRRGLGMVFQSYALWPHMSVLDNVAFPLAHNEANRSKVRRSRALAAEHKQSAFNALERVQCLHLRDRYPGELSGGQQQRIALARAIVSSPRLILLDEPLSNLDASLRQDMRAELRILQEEIGFAAIYVTHDQAEAFAMSDRIILMRDGLIEQTARPRNLFDVPATTFAASFVGNYNVLRGIIDADPADGPNVSVSTAIGRVDATLARPDIARTPGRQVTVAIRTDRIRVDKVVESDAAGHEVGHTAKVISAAYGGTHVDLTVETDDGQKVVVRERSERELPERGERVALVVLGETVVTE